jgi:hypothetical protein
MVGAVCHVANTFAFTLFVSIEKLIKFSDFNLWNLVEI